MTYKPKLGEYFKEKFKWAVIHNSTDGGLDCIRAVDRFEATSNMYKLVVDNDTLFSRYVFEHPDELKSWFLQLQDNQELKNDSLIVFFAKKEFEIAPRAPQIVITQYPDTCTDVESGLNPYVRIKIEDFDTFYDNGRVPYKVYEVDKDGKEHYLTEFNNRIPTEYSEAQLTNAFNSLYPTYSWKITKESFKKSKFHDWYEEDSKGNGLQIRTIKLDSFTPDASEAGYATDAANVLCGDGLALYYFSNNEWHRIDFSDENPYQLKEAKTQTTINNKVYDIDGIKATAHNDGSTYSFVTQSSGFIVFRSASGVHILFFDNSSKPFTIGSPAYASTSYLASTKKGNPSSTKKDNPCLIYFEGNGGTFTYYEKGTSTKVVLYKKPDSIDKIKIGASDITYVSGNQCYKQSNEAISESELYKFFTNGKAIIPSTKFDSDWEEFQVERRKEYSQYLAERLSYKVCGLSHYTEDKIDGDFVTCRGKLIVQEVDGCYSEKIDYSFKYRNIKFNVEVTKYPTTISAKDGKVILTMVSGGLAPYKVNGRSLYIGDAIELDGCYYGNQETSVEDGKGNIFNYTFDIPLPKHTIEANPQTCNGRGGEIIVICEENDLMLRDYYLKRNGNVIGRVYSASNNNKYTFSGLAIGDYEVWGEFDNGDQILLDEKQTIVDNSFAVSAVVDNATKIGEAGRVILTASHAIDNGIVWQGIVNNSSQNIGVGASISVENVAVGEYKFIATGNKGCVVNKTVNVSGPGISMYVDLTLQGQSVRIAIDSVQTKGITEYYFESNGARINNYSKVPYDKGNAFDLCLKYKTSESNDFQTYTIINERLETADISATDISDPQRCSGTNGTLKVEVKDIPQGVKCYYQIDGLDEEELSGGSQTIDVSIGEHCVYVRQEQTLSDGRINVSIHDDYQQFLTVEDGVPTDAVVIIHNVKCKGGDDGSIEILTKNGESPQNVWLCQDEVGTGEPDHATTCISGLQKGQYTYHVVDGRCPNESKSQTATITEPDKALIFVLDSITANPTCKNNDGVVVMKVSGGWGNYKMIENRDEFHEDEESYLSDKSATEGNSLSISNLSYGLHTFTIVDDELCEANASVYLKEYLAPRILSRENQLNCVKRHVLIC